MRSCSQEAISGSRDSDAGISESGPGSSGVQQSVTGRDGKPSHSYIALISMAILSSPERKMLLGDIYNYITSSFPYYNNKEKAWRNSIRHNLSLNECFVKTGRSDTGKGHFWTIHQNCIEDFARGDFRRRQARRRARRTPTSTPFPFCFSDGGLVNENPFNFGAYYSSSDFFTGRMSDIAPKFPPVEVDNSQYTTSAVGLGRSVIGSAFSPHVLPDAYPAYSGPMSLSPSKASLAPFPAFLSPLETHRPMAPSCLSDHSVHSQSSSVSTPTSASSAQQFVFPRDHGVPSWYQGLPPVSYQCTSPREEPVFCSTASSTPSPPRLDSTFRITGYPSSGTPDPPNVVTSHSAGPDTLKNLSGVTPGAMPGLTPPYSSPTGSSNTAGRTQAMSPDSGTPMSSPGEDTHTVSWLPTSSRAAAALGFDEPPRVPVYDPYVVNPMTASYRGYGPAAANMVQTCVRLVQVKETDVSSARLVQVKETDVSSARLVQVKETDVSSARLVQVKETDVSSVRLVQVKETDVSSVRLVQVKETDVSSARLVQVKETENVSSARLVQVKETDVSSARLVQVKETENACTKSVTAVSH
ncbi:hypothetical protein BaRGS_00016077 [Batillaria attramentaria]|uniref:Fork-head domain-containing protein n=1 Tax=Batillaria attramentaria TaxID=370345 RepID=A0ABD0KZX0_9CAEN